MTTGIYTIRNLANGKVYVGSAVRVERRLADHERWLRRGDHYSKHLQSAWNKYGAESFVLSLFQPCEKEHLLDYEQAWIDEYRAVECGYNNAPIAGSCIGREVSDETRAKISTRNRGRKQSPETIAKMSAAQRGRKHTPETRAKIARANLGNKRSLGKTRTQEQVKRTSDSLRATFAAKRGYEIDRNAICGRVAAGATKTAVAREFGISQQMVSKITLAMSIDGKEW